MQRYNNEDRKKATINKSILYKLRNQIQIKKQRIQIHRKKRKEKEKKKEKNNNNKRPIQRQEIYNRKRKRQP